MYYYSERQEREEEDDDYIEEEDDDDDDEDDSDGDDEHNHDDYASPTRKVAWSNNVDRYSDPFKDEKPPQPPLQQQGVAGILRRDQNMAPNFRSPNAGQASQDTTSGGDGSRVSGGGAGQAGGSGGNARSSVNGAAAASGSEQAAGSGGAAAGAGRRKLSCLSGGFCGTCQICSCNKQRQQQAPPQQQRMQRAAGGNAPLQRNNPHTNATPDTNAPPTTLKQKVLGCLCCFPRYLKFHITHPSKASLDRMQCIARSTTWTIVIVIFTIIMLFGPVIQDLAIPKEGDPVCDVFYTLTFAIMSFDIMIRCYVTPNYWKWKVNLWFLCCCFMKKERNSSGGAVASEGRQGSAGTVKSGSVGRAKTSGGAGGNGSSNSPSKEFAFRVGSFMFWCDFVSTATLIWDISYINPALRDMDTLDLGLDSKYMVVGGISSLNSGVPYEAQYAILVAIARTARIARFIRASVVVKTSSKVNWYWIPDHLSPQYWCRRCYNRFSSKKKSGSDDEWGNDSLHGGPDGERAKLSRRSSSKSSLKSSLRGGEIGQNNLAGTNNRKKKTNVFLAIMNLLRRTDKEAQKQANAAIKIQRAFRISRDSTYEVGDPNGRASSLSAEEGSGNTKKSSIVDQVKKSIRKTPLNKSSTRRVDSHVGSAMRELTGQRVAIGIIIALVLTALFTYFEYDSTDANTMVQLFLPTQNPNGDFANRSLTVAHNTSIPEIFKYQFVDGSVRYLEISGRQPDDLRNREILRITVTDVNHENQTIGWFSQRQKVHDEALIQLVSTCFILVVWFFGVTAFAGPVMMLVVTPIERMIRLLTMLMRDPLGYQNTPRYKKFESEDDDFLKNTKWTKDVLKGMETSFLMSTILQIGNLMKVGFGSAGVEIIQNTLQLQKGDRNVLNLNTQGSTVSCIFLFCDIRQFTDATECLQEEVFVFTNKIAAVVHSICHSYGGSANKNVGDAFLVSWLLDGLRPMNAPNDRDNSFVEPFSTGGSLFHRRSSNEYRNSAASLHDDELHAYDHQADKALLSVIKICISLYHDDFYTEDMSNAAKERLMDKLKKRKGPVVQMGFGLHAGKAVQGAIGSQRKLDATYIAESVEVSEFLESSTKKYGLKMLMSGDFYKLLHPNQKRRCRKIDQILFHNEDDDVSDAGNMIDEEDVMELHTFDMDIDSLWKTTHNHNRGDPMETASDSEASVRPTMGTGDAALKRSRRNVTEGKSMHDRKSLGRRVSLMAMGLAASHHTRDDLQDNQKKSGKDMGITGSTSGTQGAGAGGTGGMPSSPSEGDNENGKGRRAPELTLPTGPVPYNASVWLSDEMKEIRKRYSGGIFFPKFNAGLQSFYARDWQHARQCFQTILERFDDGPSRYFLNIIEENNGLPPRNFNGYGTA